MDVWLNSVCRVQVPLFCQPPDCERFWPSFLLCPLPLCPLPSFLPLICSSRVRLMEDFSFHLAQKTAKTLPMEPNSFHQPHLPLFLPQGAFALILRPAAPVHFPPTGSPPFPTMSPPLLQDSGRRHNPVAVSFVSLLAIFPSRKDSGHCYNPVAE